MVTQAQTPLKLSIRKNDMVEIIAGKEKGKSGKVIAVDMIAARVTVEKVNLVKRHVKPSQKNPQGGVVEKELPIHYSNVLLMCPKCNRGVRHGRRVEAAAASKKKKGATAGAAQSETTKKIRFCKRCDQSLG